MSPKNSDKLLKTKISLFVIVFEKYSLILLRHALFVYIYVYSHFTRITLNKMKIILGSIGLILFTNDMR